MQNNCQILLMICKKKIYIDVHCLKNSTDIKRSQGDTTNTTPTSFTDDTNK